MGMDARWTVGTAAAIAGGLTFLVLGCAINPVSGRPQAVLASEASEIESGRKAALELESALGLVEDRTLTAYVAAIGQRLVVHSSRSQLPHRFRVLDIQNSNALALPSGDIYVSRGLLAQINTEDELANVLAHEIAHVAARHAASQRVREAAFLPVQMAAAVAGMAGSILSPNLGRAVSGVAEFPGRFLFAQYSRNQEIQADRLGQRFVAAAGWDPAGLSGIMTTFAREESLHSSRPRAKSFFSSHPNSEERSAAAALNADQLNRAGGPSIATDRQNLLARLEGLVVGASAHQGVMVGNRFLHPELHFAVTFPEGWETRNKRSAVIARSPDGKRFFTLTLPGTGDDPLLPARAFERRRGLRHSPQSLRIGGFSAAHGVHVPSRDRQGPALHLTWIAYRGRIYQLTGISPRTSFPGDVAIFNRVSRSFRRLVRGERNEVREWRLRFTEARRGEPLARLLARAGSEWTAREAAVANGLEADVVLFRGQYVKFPRLELYGHQGP